jgi:hypothetical protein
MVADPTPIAQRASALGRAAIDAPLRLEADLISAELAEIEVLKATLEARQARLALVLDATIRQTRVDQGRPTAFQGKGIAEHVGLSRRLSPSRGRRLLSLTKRLQDLPGVMDAFTDGDINEHRAFLIAREVTHLDRQQRSLLDRRLTREIDLSTASDRAITARTRAIVGDLDPETATRRRHAAEADRTVTLRPAPDNPEMAWLTAHLPIAQAQAVFQSLAATADQMIACGVAANRGNTMADLLVARSAGTRALAQTPSSAWVNAVPSNQIALNLVMSDTEIGRAHV